MTVTAVDRDGRRWALLAIDGVLRARLVHGSATPAHMELSELIRMCGPLVLSPARADTMGYAAFMDTVDLVASDPATASVESVDQVARFARSIVLPGGHAG